MKFVVRVSVSRTFRWRGFDKREYRIRELLPNGKVRRRDREPSESEQVSARLGYVSHLLPTNFGDPQ
jgi:hypothetical protein